MMRAFGTDALNAHQQSPHHTQHASSSSSGKQAPAKTDMASYMFALRKQPKSGLGDKVLGIDRTKVSKDRSWLRDMDKQHAPAPVCRSFVDTGFCAYGDECGFDHPAPSKHDDSAPAASLPTPTSPTFSSIALPPSSKPQRISVPVTVHQHQHQPQPPSRRASEPHVQQQPPMPLAPSRNANANILQRRRDASPLKSSPQQAFVVDSSRRRDSSVGRGRTLDRRASVFESRAVPNQPTFMVPSSKEPSVVRPGAHPDAPPAVPILPPMFYATYRRGSNGEVLDPALIPHAVQAQKSLYYRTKPCRYWNAGQECPKAEKCTFIHDPSLGPGAQKSEEDMREEMVVEEVVKPTSPAPVSIVRTQTPVAQRPRLPPPMSPTKLREPHPAWRVVGGGVTLANFRTAEDQMDEDAVEQELLGSAQQSQPQQPQNSFPAYAHPQYAPFAAPQPAPVYQQQQQPAYAPVQYTSPMTPYAPPPPPPMHNQGPLSAYGVPLALHGTPVPDAAWGGWTMHVIRAPGEPVPYYSTLPMYGPPGVVYVPPGHAKEAVAPQAPQQQQVQYEQAPTPVLYGTTPSAYVYGYPTDARALDGLAAAGVNPTFADEQPQQQAPSSYFEGFTFDQPAQQHEEERYADMYGGEDELAALEGYGADASEFEGQDAEVGMGVMGLGMVSAIPVDHPSTTITAAPSAYAQARSKADSPSSKSQKRPMAVQAKWSWADEVEEMDPQWTTRMDVDEQRDQQQGQVTSSSWPQCATSPNSPRNRARHFHAESP